MIPIGGPWAGSPLPFPGRALAGFLAALFLVTTSARPAGGQNPDTVRAAGPSDGTGTEIESPVQEQLRRRIEASGERGPLSVGGEVVRATPTVASFYERRAYRPVWVTGQGPTALAEQLLDVLADAEVEGLGGADYHMETVREILSRVGAAGSGAGGAEPSDRAREPGGTTAELGALVDVELLLADAFFTYGSHLLRGRVDPETLHPDWLATPRAFDSGVVLEAAVAAGDVRSALASLLPPQTGYRSLRDALARYRRIASRGGWPEVGAGPRLEPGARDARVAALRRRMAATGDLPPDAPGEGATDPELYGDRLAEGVRRFQRRHGLAPDAIVGPATRAALDTPVEARIRQIVLNLERWRWLPQDLGDRHLIVNAADFELAAVEGDSTVLRSRAIVGRPYRRTPVFSDTVTYLVLNPYWNVPHNLAVLDQLPLQRADSGYFRRIGMRVFRGWGSDAVEVDPSSVDWERVTADGFPYRLRQDPGPVNALGRIKFMFPNRFSVYLHDTPTRDLFARSVRDFSSGCIRVERARELASWLLGEGEAGARRLEAGWDEGGEQTVPLDAPVPVHLLYWTAWADDDGTVQFRRDIYGRDEALDDALAEVGSGEAGDQRGTAPPPHAAAPR